MTGDTHYDLEVLAELAEGLLDDATARQVREHLAVCDPCGEHLADLAAVRELLAAIPMPAMPLGVANAHRPGAGRRGRTGTASGGVVGLAETAARLGELDAATPRGPAARLRGGCGPTAPGRSRYAARRGRRGRHHRPGQANEGRTTAPVGDARGRRCAAAAAVVAGTAGWSRPACSPPVAAAPSRAGTRRPDEPRRAPQRCKGASPGLRGVPTSGYNYTEPGAEAAAARASSALAPGVRRHGDDEARHVRQAVRQSARPHALRGRQGAVQRQRGHIMAFWEDKAINAVRVVLVDPSNCKNPPPGRSRHLGRLVARR